MERLSRLNLSKLQLAGIGVQLADWLLTLLLIVWLGFGHEGNPVLAGLTRTWQGFGTLLIVKTALPLILYPRLSKWQQKAVTLGMTAVCLFNLWLVVLAVWTLPR